MNGEKERASMKTILVLEHDTKDAPERLIMLANEIAKTGDECVVQRLVGRRFELRLPSDEPAQDSGDYLDWQKSTYEELENHAVLATDPFHGAGVVPKAALWLMASFAVVGLVLGIFSG
jgi:hypothetical protein